MNMKHRLGPATDQQRSDVLRRSWHLIALLRSTWGCTLQTLAREIGVSERTVRRDLNALERAGLPLQRVSDTDSEQGKPWKLVKGSPCPICGRHIATGKEYRETQATDVEAAS